MTTENHAEKQARAQVESIVAMVAALECDYARLDELRGMRAMRAEFVYEYCAATGAETTAAQKTWVAEFTAASTELEELEAAAGNCTSEDEAREAIEQGPLAVEVRSNWHAPGEPGEPEEFRIVLCTGGPHVEIVGDLDRGEPSRPRILYRDWGTSGELFDFDREAVLTYCRVFYFGE